MTEEQALAIYEEMVEEFGDKLPNPEHSPREFAYFYKLYKLIKKNAKPE